MELYRGSVVVLVVMSLFAVIADGCVVRARPRPVYVAPRPTVVVVR